MKIDRDENGGVARIEMLSPFDAHTHLRQGDALSSALWNCSQQFWGAMAMPNLKPPLISVEQCEKYLAHIDDLQQKAVQQNSWGFRPCEIYGTLYLTENVDLDDIRKVAENPKILAVKLYPAGVTTGSSQGVGSIQGIMKHLELMEELGIPLSVHGESSDPDVDIFDREARFVDEELLLILTRFSKLHVILEHVSTEYAANFFRRYNEKRLAVTIASQHILYNRNDMLAGGMRPDLFCLPVLKREHDREAVLKLATSGAPNVFLGTDTAPHPRDKKYSEVVPGGFNARGSTLQMYIEAFERVGKLDQFEAFASINGPKFYGLAPAEDTVTIEKNHDDDFVIS